MIQPFATVRILMRSSRIFHLLLVGAWLGFFSGWAVAAGPPANAPAFPPSIESYDDAGVANLWTILFNRVQAEPFNLVATVIFLLAIIHTFLAPKILRWSHRIQHAYEEQIEKVHGPGFKEKIPDRLRQSVPAAILHFFGEVEAIFGLWVVPLALMMWIDKGSESTRNYLNFTVQYTEPLFVVVIMAIAASRPIVQLAIRVLGLLAGRSSARWWLVLLTIGPLLGSLITEPAAMTICALLLGREFYRLGPSHRFMYATLGLLFVNVSVGGALTNFAAPPVLMVAGKWGWGSADMFAQFGGRAIA